jgi:hypothetical protein
VTAPSPVDRKALSIALARNAWLMAQACTDERVRASLLKMADHWATRARLQDSLGAALKPESLMGGASQTICLLRARYGGQWEKAAQLAWRERSKASQRQA